MSQQDASTPGEPILVQINPLMREIVPAFLDNAREDAQALRAALAQHDFGTVARLGHGMKGASGIGFDGLKELGMSLEDAAKLGDPREIEQLILGLEDYLDRVQPV